MRIHRLIILSFALIVSAPAYAARCGGDFNTFVQNMSAEAASAGISQATIAQALGGVQQDFGVLAFDRRQRGTSPKPSSNMFPPA
jgi:membrane-bound lytic murein transglycosylase B